MRYTDYKQVRLLAKSILTDDKKMIALVEGLRGSLKQLRATFLDDGYDEVEVYANGLMQKLSNAQESFLVLAQELLEYSNILEAAISPTHNTTVVRGENSSHKRTSVPRTIAHAEPQEKQKNERASNRTSAGKAKDDKWNEDYMPLVHANIRRSVELHFSDYVSEEKLSNCLSALSFMNQNELAKRYGRGFQKGTLGFNDGDSSNIAHDIKGVTYDGRVGNINIPGSGNTNINYALVTAIHENLHMMSANDTPFEIRRGIMVGSDETSRAMNEAFTEYFTFISCGGDTPLGGYYPGVYSGYQILMQEMPTIEKAVGRDCMMDAYFNNNPQRMRKSIDAILGAGAWDDMCAASYDVMYNNNANNAAARLSGYLRKLSAT